jgi:hypothetical protein
LGVGVTGLAGYELLPDILPDNSQDPRALHLSWGVDVPYDGVGLQLFSTQSTVRKTAHLPDILKARALSAWETVGVMATSRVMLAEQRQATPGSRNALAFRLGNSNLLKIGIIPDEPDFLEMATPPGDKAAVGMLVGPEDLQASIGLYIPAERRFMLPRAGVSNLGVTTIDQLSNDFPGVRYSA